MGPETAVIIRFVKTPNAKDRAYIEREDGSAARWSFPSYGPLALPHDLVHYVVESELGLSRGLWGLVAGGADIERVNQAASRDGGPVAEKYAALGDLSELLVAELFAGQPWSAAWSSDEALLEALEAGYAELAAAPPEGFGRSMVQALRAAVEAMRGRWLALGEKGTLVLGWPVERTVSR